MSLESLAGQLGRVDPQMQRFIQIETEKQRFQVRPDSNHYVILSFFTYKFFFFSATLGFSPWTS